MGTLAALSRFRPSRAFAALLLALPAAALAQPAGPASWEDAYRAAFAARVAGEAGAGPSPLALRISLAAGERCLRGLTPEEAADRCYGQALDVERSIRFGSSPQEAFARLAQSLGLSAGGSKAGKRFASEKEKRLVIGRGAKSKPARSPRGAGSWKAGGPGAGAANGNG